MGFDLRKILVPNEAKLARYWQERAEEIAKAPLRAELARFEESTRSEPDGSRVLLARARSVTNEPFWAGLTPEELFAGHGWVTGAPWSDNSGPSSVLYTVGCCRSQRRVVGPSHRSDSPRTCNHIETRGTAAKSPDHSTVRRNLPTDAPHYAA